MMTTPAPASPHLRKRRLGTHAFWFRAALLLLMLAASWLFIYVADEPTRVGIAPTGATAATNAAGPERATTQAETPVSIVPVASDAIANEHITRLFDPRLSVAVRRQAARALAQLDSEEAFAALKAALTGNNPSWLKAAVAESLGECSLAPGALLQSLARDPDETIARGAVRGLGARGDPDAVNALGDLLFSAQSPASTRAEAAFVLGDAELPVAREWLQRAALEFEDDALVEDVFNGLGKQPFADTEEFFRSYLASPEPGVERKAAALEALGNAPGDTGPLLLEYLGHADPDLRAASAWALISADGAEFLGPQLGEALKKESVAMVRERLFLALANQAVGDPQFVLPLVQNESDRGARLAGMRSLAGWAATSPEVAAYFNETAVPELQRLACGSGELADRMSALLALARARTPPALEALKLAAQSDNRTVAAAARGALRTAPE